MRRRYGLATLLAIIGGWLLVLGLLGVRLQSLLMLLPRRGFSGGSGEESDATATIVFGAALLGIFGTVALIEFLVSRRRDEG